MFSYNSRPEEMQLESTSLSREHSAKIGINEDLWRSGLLGPIYMVSGTRDNPLPETYCKRKDKKKQLLGFATRASPLYSY